ncbi:hypothetical protein FACS189490_04600 [Clostridia bacterium]|nr:hypothetical protein FACS189490_04600 [Clostridia bacterium]
MDNETKNCYLGINGKKLGPLSERDIQTLLERGKITAETKFARVGDKQWTTVGKSGIIEAEEKDVLPPLPQEDKSAASNGAKKSLIPAFIAAGAGMAIVAAVIVLMVILISNIGNNPVAPANNNTMQAYNTPKSSPSYSPQASEPAPVETAVTENVEPNEEPLPNAALPSIIGGDRDDLARQVLGTFGKYLESAIVNGDSGDLTRILEGANSASLTYWLKEIREDEIAFISYSPKNAACLENGDLTLGYYLDVYYEHDYTLSFIGDIFGKIAAADDYSITDAGLYPAVPYDDGNSGGMAANPLPPKQNNRDSRDSRNSRDKIVRR